MRPHWELSGFRGLARLGLDRILWWMAGRLLTRPVSAYASSNFARVKRLIGVASVRWSSRESEPMPSAIIAPADTSRSWRIKLGRAVALCRIRLARNVTAASARVLRMTEMKPSTTNCSATRPSVRSTNCGMKQRLPPPWRLLPCFRLSCARSRRHSDAASHGGAGDAGVSTMGSNAATTADRAMRLAQYGKWRRQRNAPATTAADAMWKLALEVRNNAANGRAGPTLSAIWEKNWENKSNHRSGCVVSD